MALITLMARVLLKILGVNKSKTKLAIPFKLKNVLKLIESNKKYKFWTLNQTIK